MGGSTRRNRREELSFLKVWWMKLCEPGGVNVMNWGIWAPMIFLSCSHSVLQTSTAGYSADTTPHSNAAGQDGIDEPCVEGAHDGSRDYGSSQSALKVEMQKMLLGQ